MKIICSLCLTSLFSVHLLLSLPTSAHATPEFARKYKAKCKSCHIKNTAAELTQTGLDFKSSLDKARTQQGQKADTKTSPDPAKKDEAKPTGEEVKTGPQAEDENKQPKPEEPEPVRTIYRWTRQDGTMVFTDNADLLLKNPPVTKEKKRVKSARPHARSAKVEKNPMKSADAGSSASAGKKPKLSFSHCMDEILVQQLPTDDTLQMMNIFKEAERKCSH